MTQNQDYDMNADMPDFQQFNPDPNDPFETILQERLYRREQLVSHGFHPSIKLETSSDFNLFPPFFKVERRNRTSFSPSPPPTPRRLGYSDQIEDTGTWTVISPGWKQQAGTPSSPSRVLSEKRPRRKSTLVTPTPEPPPAHKVWYEAPNKDITCRCGAHFTGDHARKNWRRHAFPDQSITQYSCSRPGCTYTSARKDNRNQHELRPHDSSSRRRYLCPARNCGRSYDNIRDLNRHIHACHGQSESQF